MSLENEEQVLKWFDQLSATRIMAFGSESIHLNIHAVSSSESESESGRQHFGSTLACFNSLNEAKYLSRAENERWDIFLCFYIDECRKIEQWTKIDWNWFTSTRIPPELFVIRKERGLFEQTESYRCAVNYSEMGFSSDDTVKNVFQYSYARSKKDADNGVEFQRTFNVFFQI